MHRDYVPSAGMRRFQVGTPPIIALSALDAALDAFDGCRDSTGIEQIELPCPGRSDVVVGRLEEWQERAAEHTQPSGDEQPHRLPKLAVA